MIVRHADRLSRLTQDLLDLSRLESGLWAMRFTEIELAPLVRSIVDLHAYRASSKSIRLGHSVPAGMAARGDERALEQVLVNLVDNAIKYTPTGGAVTVSARADDRWVVISVEDTGPGIEPEHLPRVFERFYRADPGRSREQGGTGLGQANGKHRTPAPRGITGVESGPAGSCFWVKLPGAMVDERR
jgi:two-component system phosphate regulon sensor histidine kinase PhoR